MIHGMDGKKLSKRHGATAVADYRNEGILPSAMVNFLALMGWSPGGDREVMTLEEMIAVPKLVHGPCLLNVVWGGKTPTLDLREAAALGFKLAIVPGLLLKATIGACDEALAELMVDLFGWNPRCRLALSGKAHEQLSIQGVSLATTGQ